MIEIPLQCGRVALISDVDGDRVRQHKWRSNTHNASGQPYVCTTVRLPETGRWTTVYLHRFIVSPPKTMKVDHRDTNTLNNQRPNLRVATFWQNNNNRRGFGLVSYKGVTQDRGRYRARITLDGIERNLGGFLSAIEAAKAYDAAAHEAFGEFAWLNFPEDYPAPVHDIEPLDIPF